MKKYANSTKQLLPMVGSMIELQQNTNAKHKNTKYKYATKQNSCS